MIFYLYYCFANITLNSKSNTVLLLANTSTYLKLIFNNLLRYLNNQ